jgi:hypothetical protein
VTPYKNGCAAKYFPLLHRAALDNFFILSSYI